MCTAGERRCVYQQSAPANQHGLCATKKL
uniref:Uncharacterized protein n=1 Tax=Anguilla anguilla TaxID=7936 RepID=A0A0E9UES3_ANGAN